MDELFFDYLPDEIIYVIIKCLNNDSINSLTSLSENYRKIYNLYVGNIHKGFEFSFKLMKVNDITIVIKSDSVFEKSVTVNLHRNFDSHFYKWILSKILNIKDLRDVIYAEYDDKSIPQIVGIDYLTLIYTSKDLGYVFHEEDEDTFDDANVETFRSWGWKEIWNKLSLDQQNALLHQNGFPVKSS